MKSIIRNPWFIGGLGILALSLFVYFVGPLIGFGESRPLEGIVARLITILLIIVVWASILLIRRFRAGKAARQITEGIVEADAAGSDGARSAEEVATLKARFEEAIGVLRKSGTGKGNTLYELPWYIIIGPPGAGKTTALINSGLKFPLAEKFGESALRGVGGTRNCDWWFTEEAILLDTAGRYTTQDSQASVDKAAWEGFLDLLRRYRKRRPINGVLVAVSVTDFMDPVERRKHASAIRSRIRELDEFFGMRFPVYVLVTKCDLVNGFIEHFDDLGREEREQVWGVTLSLEESENQKDVGELIAKELGALFARLDERTLMRLHQERDLSRRSQIFSFPQQVQSLRAPLAEFLDEVFRSSRFEESALLRGVYFTSGTQEGTPIDRVMTAISRTFGLPQQALAPFSGHGRSYFLTRLLQQVVFQESGVAGTNQRAEKRRAWLQRVSYAGVLLLVSLLLAGWTASYLGNSALIDATAEQVAAADSKLAEIPRNRHEPEVALPGLNSVRSIVSTTDEFDAFTGLGLSQRESLAEQAAYAYRRALVSQLLPRVMLRLEQQVNQTQLPLDYTYEALKVYLRLGQEKRYDAGEIGAWVTLDWQARLPREMGQEGYEALLGHLTALLEQRPAPLPLPLDDAAIRDARQRLLRVSVEERIYARIKTLDLGEDLDGFTILDRAGPESLLVFVRDSGRPLTEGIPPFYTKAGYRKIFANSDSYRLVQDLTSEQWVLRDEVDLGSPDDVAELILKLRDIYFADYVREYKTLIYDIELAPFNDAREAASILNVLARPSDSPLTNLIEEVRRETSFSEPEGAPAEGEEAGNDAFAAQRERLERLLGERARTAVGGTRSRQFANIVEEQFAEFHELAGGQKGDSTGATPITHLVGLLRELADFMMLVAREETADGVPPHVVERGRATLQKVQFEADRQEVPLLKTLLRDAATSTDNIASGGAAANIEAQWQSGPLAFCRRAIENRYPVVKNATSEIRIEDFGRFFGFGGELDKFFESYLKERIDTSTRPWRAAQAGGTQISPDAIRQFERARSVRDTFFRGDTSPYVGFELTPVSMDPGVTQFSLSIDGQATQYFHGPRISQSFGWPGPQGVGEVRMEMAPGNGTPMKTERGPWAWFRVLDQARMQNASKPEHFEVVFEMGGRTATYELVARSAYNPFKLEDLSEFRCAARLTR